MVLLIGILGKSRSDFYKIDIISFNYLLTDFFSRILIQAIILLHDSLIHDAWNSRPTHLKFGIEILKRVFRRSRSDFFKIIQD